MSLPFLYRADQRRFPALASLYVNGGAGGRKRLAAFETVLDDTRRTLADLNLMPTNRAHSINGLVWADDETSTEQAAIARGGRADEWINLLVLESVGDFCFGDAGSVAFCVHRQDLAAGDFSNVTGHVSG